MANEETVAPAPPPGATPRPARPSWRAWLKALVTPILLATAFGLFIAGVCVPFFDVTKIWIFHDSVSVISGLVEMARAGEWFLFVVIFVFTLVFPAAKLTALGIVWHLRRRHDERADRVLRWVGHLGKWSMLDVFVVAILIVTIKAAAIANVAVDTGLYLFTASVLLTQIAAFRLERRLR